MSVLTRLVRPTAPTVDRAGLVQVYETWRNTPAQLDYSWTGAITSFKTVPPLFAVMWARLALFTEVRFAYIHNNTNEYKTDRIPMWLQNPRELLSRMIQDVDLVGNSYTHITPDGKWQRLRPDWTGVVHNDKEIIGYAYQAGGLGSGEGPLMALLPDEVMHWRGLYPDPTHPFMGMSWLVPLAHDLNNDRKMAAHKGRFFDNAATPNMIITFAGKLADDTRKLLRDGLATRHEGFDNAYKTMLLDGGADVKMVGSSFKDMDFSVLANAGETRIASAAGVPPVIVGFRDGLEAATYSNYMHAMRRFADHTMRPLWGSAVDTLRQFLPLVRQYEFDYDDRRVPALQQDAKDDAEIQRMKATTMQILILSGFDPLEVAKAVMNNDIENLEHTGAIPTTLYQEENGEETPTSGVQSDNDAEASSEEGS